MAETAKLASLANDIPSEPFGSVPELIAGMQSITPLLDHPELRHSKAFHSVYTSVSNNVWGDVLLGNYEYPDIVAGTMPIFAKEWFDPLRNYMLGDRDAVPQAWQVPLYDERAKRLPPAVQFQMGMFTHIMYDLPEALRISNPGDEYYKDFTRGVNRSLNTTALQVSPELLPKLNPQSRKFVTAVAVYGVASIRDTAWTDFKMLQAIDTVDGGETAYAHIRQRQDARVARRNRAVARACSIALAGVDAPLQLRREAARLRLPR